MAQRPDEVTTGEVGTTFTAHSEGQFAMLCVDVVNLGTSVEQFQNHPPKEVDKVALVFASGERQEDGSLTVVSVEMSNYMSDRANLRKFLEAWRGKSYTAEQATQGVPLHKLHGQPGLFSIEHVLTKRGRTFAKVRSVSPLPKAMPAPNGTVMDEYERPKFLEDKKAQYAEDLAKHRAAQRTKDTSGGHFQDGPDDYDGPDPDDDLPF